MVYDMCILLIFLQIKNNIVEDGDFVDLFTCHNTWK